MSLKVHLTSQAPNRQHPPGPSVLFNGSLSFNEHLSHDILRFAEAGCSEPFRQPHSGHEKPPGHIWGSQLSLHSQAMGVGVLGQEKHCRGVTDLPVRCSSSQSPWPPPPCPPSWGVSPFICTFSPPEYMFFLGKDTGTSPGPRRTLANYQLCYCVPTTSPQKVQTLRNILPPAAKEGLKMSPGLSKQ